jgi:hypothetical protein
VQASLGAPGDLDHPGVLTVLAAREAVADGGALAIVIILKGLIHAGLTGPQHRRTITDLAARFAGPPFDPSALDVIAP